MELATGSLKSHQQAQNRKETPPQGETATATPDPMIYRVSFPRVTESIGYPVEVCKGRETTRTNLRIHFILQHMRDMIVIMEEGNRHHPRCLDCAMFIL